MKIISAHFVAGASAYYFDDQTAIRAGASQDGFVYRGHPQTAGFTAVRQPGESVSVMLQLASGHWAQGDCVAVQYSGAGGRDSLFTADAYLQQLNTTIGPQLVGLAAETFVQNAQLVDGWLDNGRSLHTAIRYGISQALLEAAALAGGKTKTEVICGIYELPLPTAPVPLFAQSGDDRHTAVDKMILRRVDALPHALINNVEEKLGRNGEKLLDYVSWLVRRIHSVSRISGAAETYRPTLHIDVYGTLGLAFDNNVTRIADYLCQLDDAAGDYPLYIEGPVDMGSRAAQIECLHAIRSLIDQRSNKLRIVADEWCNTLADVRAFADAGCCHMVQIKTPDLGSIHNVVDAVLYSQRAGVEAYQGGSCNETDLSARCCTQVALACRPQRLLVKPGMGVDEGFQIVANEMSRTLAQVNHTRASSGSENPPP